MSALPKISIVTPSYNQGQFIEATIQSVLNQHYPNLEFFIMDGGSTDNTVEVIQRYADQIDYWVSEPDNGQTHAINKGLARATGDIIGYLNSDDQLLDGTLHFVADQLQNSDAWWLAGAGNYTYADGSKLQHTPKVPPCYGPQIIVRPWAADQPSTFWRRKCFDLVGNFNETLNFTLDTDFMARLLLHGRRPLLTDRALSHAIIHTASKTGQATTSADKPFSQERYRFGDRLDVYLTTEEKQVLHVWRWLRQQGNPLYPRQPRPTIGDWGQALRQPTMTAFEVMNTIMQLTKLRTPHIESN